MRVLIAPQEFKGSLAADEAAAAIAAGIRAARPGWQLDLLPLSDGGPGLLDALRRAVRADTAAAVVHDPLGRPVLGRYLRLRETGDAVIEAAQANGLFHLKPEERDALRADTFGVGELIAAAAADEPPRMLIGVGGSATTDGGAGALRALGARFLDGAGADIPPGGGPLARLERIEWNPPAWLGRFSVVVAADVRSPLCGPAGAARVFAPQKGASPAEVDLLEEALERFAAVVRRVTGVDLRDLPGAGAAGGLAGGLRAFLGAAIESGFDIVAGVTRFAGRLAAADLVITGEGSYDEQSLAGKVTGRVLEAARAAGKPAVVFAGRASLPGARTLAALEPDPARAMERAADLLRQLAADWAAEQPA
ncbi:glycerate kinase [Tepidiforma flava]|uniref:Glycerate kinase n=1 Tax=Tepidiforma flava TaxID=3004094 RepID=A0ABY7MBB8_9CHLR|nr:glycerate kinase [Tepidiforma flava]WBL36926.1 glycerate kinase [Tepidiforma flava]